MYRNTEPLTNLYSGTTHPITVQGHPGIFGVGLPQAATQFEAVLWRPTPEIALVVNGYELSETDLIRIADNVEYESGGTLTYPTHPEVAVTRAQAVAAAGSGFDDAHATLTSFGELDVVATGVANHFPTLATDIAVTQPVWVVWTPNAGSETRAVVVIVSGGTAAVAAKVSIKERVLDSLTDRSAPSCAPPFGVLSRSEVAYLRPPLSGANLVTKFTTEGAISSMSDLSGFFDCSLDVCDRTVPVWVLIQTATSQLFTNMESRPPGVTPGDTKPGSFSINILDARTGPQGTNVGNTGELGGGPAPAGVLAITDLAPG